MCGIVLVPSHHQTKLIEVLVVHFVPPVVKHLIWMIFLVPYKGVIKGSLILQK